MTCRVNSGQEKMTEKASSQHSELCTQAAGDTVLRNQKECCSWVNVMEAGAYEACRMVIRGSPRNDEKSIAYPDFSLVGEVDLLRRHTRRSLVSALE